MPNLFAELFGFRRSIARLGQSDWLGWWDCHALSPTGDYVSRRLFRRTPQVSAAHIAILAARREHRRLLPKERLVHLFDFGESLEGAFERWLIARKADNWVPAPPLPGPTDETKDDPTAALRAAGFSFNGSGFTEGSTFLVEAADVGLLDDPAEVLKLAGRLAAAYATSRRGRLVAPYARIRS